MIKLSVSPKKDRPRLRNLIREAYALQRLRDCDSSAGGGDVSGDVDGDADGDDLPPEAIEIFFKWKCRSL